MTSPGLRERKKQKTRWAIQEHALRLIAAQGYDATTVDQIAAAAEISPSTFFRYFKTKEDLIFEDEYDAILESGWSTLDKSLSPLDAVRTTMMETLAGLSPAEQQKLIERTRLIRSVPALRARSMENITRTVDTMAAGVAEWTGRPADSLEVRVFAGAVIGALTAVITTWVDQDGRDWSGLIDQVMTLLSKGLPL